MGSNEFNNFLKEMIANGFFTNVCAFTKEERDQKEDWIALTKGMLLLDADYESKERSDAALIAYITWARENYDDCKMNTIKSVVEYLEASFINRKMKIKKGNISILMSRAFQAMYEEVEPKDFYDKWNEEEEWNQYQS